MHLIQRYRMMDISPTRFDDILPGIRQFLQVVSSGRASHCRIQCTTLFNHRKIDITHTYILPAVCYL